MLLTTCWFCWASSGERMLVAATRLWCARVRSRLLSVWLWLTRLATSGGTAAVLSLWG